MNELIEIKCTCMESGECSCEYSDVLPHEVVCMCECECIECETIDLGCSCGGEGACNCGA